MSDIAKIPTLQELVSDSEMSLKENALMVILNQEPPKQWLADHPTAKIKKVNEEGKEITVPLPYLPIARVEYLLSRIYGKWWVEVLDSKVIANSVSVTVRVFVRNPITGEIDHNDGVGAAPIQTDKGAGAMDWNFAKSNGVQLALPAAKAYAIKDAAENFGKLFGKDITRKDVINYDTLLKDSVTPEDKLEEIKELYALKIETLDKDLVKDIERVIEQQDVKAYNKILKKLKEHEQSSK